MKHTEFESFYPSRFSTWTAMETTDSTPVTSGNLVVGNVYFISSTGDDTTDFPGSITNEYGESFVATSTTAVYGGATLEDITEGSPTLIGYFYGEPLTLQFKWVLTYNTDGDCTSVKVLGASGKFIRR